MNDEAESLEDAIVWAYRQLVGKEYPDHVSAWPILSGFNLKFATLGTYEVLIFDSTNNPVMRTTTGIGELPTSVANVDLLDDSNTESVRRSIEKHYRLKAEDAVVFRLPDGNVNKTELSHMLRRHAAAMGLSPMKIFLSHKGANKPTVRDYKLTLVALGFDPWLDEDAMHAGISLERGILKGFQESCAVIFFITPQFKDENYLATEIEYALTQKRAKGDKFSIITIVINSTSGAFTVPDLLRPYVWKSPASDLEALREILRALPIQVGSVHWR